jgi:hypothetical protein
MGAPRRGKPTPPHYAQWSCKVPSVAEMTLPEGLQQLLAVFAVVSLLALALAVVLGLMLWRSLRKLKVTPGAGFWQTLREVPLGLAVLLDLLDLALDVFSTPIVWWLLGRLNLRALRDVASVEALIPFTGPLPTMTVSWFLARLGVGPGAPPPRGGGGAVLEGEPVAPGKWRVRN